MAKRRPNRALEDIKKEKMELQMTPMIDVTFLLLIFFLCTIKFKVLEGKLAAYLPKDVGVNPTPSEPRTKIEIKLEVIAEGSRMDPRNPSQPWSGQGRYVLGPDRRVSYMVGPQRYAGPEEVQRRLRELKDMTPDDPVTIDPRPGIVYGEVVEILDAALQVGFLEVTFAGDYSQQMQRAAAR